MNRFHRTISTCALKQLALVTPRSTSRCVSSFKIIRTNGIYNLGKLNSNGYIALTRQFGATASGKVEVMLILLFLIAKNTIEFSFTLSH